MAKTKIYLTVVEGTALAISEHGQILNSFRVMDTLMGGSERIADRVFLDGYEFIELHSTDERFEKAIDLYKAAASKKNDRSNPEKD